MGMGMEWEVLWWLPVRSVEVKDMTLEARRGCGKITTERSDASGRTGFSTGGLADGPELELEVC